MFSDKNKLFVFWIFQKILKIFWKIEKSSLQPPKISEKDSRGAIFAQKKICNYFQIKKNCSKHGRIICEIEIFSVYIATVWFIWKWLLVPFESKTDWERCFQTKKIVRFLNFSNIFGNFLRNRVKLFPTNNNIWKLFASSY